MSTEHILKSTHLLVGFFQTTDDGICMLAIIASRLLQANCIAQLIHIAESVNFFFRKPIVNIKLGDL